MDDPHHCRQRALQLRVQLRGVSPPIWRRLVVPLGATIRALHDALQTAMGWEDCHCHAFSIRGQPYGVPRPGGIGFYTSPDRFMERLDGCFIDDFFEWLAEAVRDGTPMAEVRREIIAQEPWLERRFDRRAANLRLHGSG